MVLLRSAAAGVIRRCVKLVVRSQPHHTQQQSFRIVNKSACTPRFFSMDALKGDRTRLCSLSDVVASLKTLAPLNLAESWDNVGLLVEPSDIQRISTIFLTNDLTEPVLEEAISLGANFIVSYHPPIFSPLKSLTTTTFKERVILKAIEAHIAIYSPHTALDAVVGGVNDWLAAGLGEGRVKPLSFKEVGPEHSNLVLIRGFADEAEVKVFAQKLSEELGNDHIKDYKSSQSQHGESMMTLYCDKKNITDILSITSMKPILSVEMKPAIFVEEHLGTPVLGGCGRLVVLDNSLSLKDVVEKVKKHLQLQHVRVALGNGTNLDTSIKTVAICAGSGSTLLRNVEADLYLSGEMTHHAVLEANAAGTSVILCEHTNTERGYLKVLKESLLTQLSGKDVNIVISQVDRDPLQTM